VPDYAGEYGKKAYGNYLYQKDLEGITQPPEYYLGKNREFVDEAASRGGTAGEYGETVLKGEGLRRWLADQIALGKQELDNLDTWLQQDPSGQQAMEAFQAIAKGGRHPILKNPELIPPAILKQFLTAKVAEGPLANQHLVKRMISEGWSPLEFARLRDALDRNPDLINDFIRKPGAKDINELRRQIMQVPGTAGYQGSYDEYHNMRTIAENPLPQSKPQTTNPPPGGSVPAPGTLYYPATGRVTGLHADARSRGRRLHAGMDIAGQEGSAVIARSGGTVVRAQWQQGYGWTVDVQRPDGTVDRYGHLRGFNVQIGQPVSAGETIAAMGHTGSPGIGTHLHYEHRMRSDFGYQGTYDPVREMGLQRGSQMTAGPESTMASPGSVEQTDTSRIDKTLRDGGSQGKDTIDVTVKSEQGSGTKTSVETAGSMKDNETVTRETTPVLEDLNPHE
jgi:murein DD-endopeptidase MepM/ murein hydrolase activator NlpD